VFQNKTTVGDKYNVTIVRLYKNGDVWKESMKTIFRQISADWVESHLGGVTVLDARDTDEREADANSIRPAVAIPLADLVSGLNEIPTSKPIVTVCHFGKRSAG